MAYVFNPFTGNLDSYGPVLTGTGTVSAAADGTAALPGIAFANNLNTGIYRPGADQLAISTNGSGRLFVNNIGNVGIGTATPGSALEINAAASTSPFIAKINTSEAARIDSSGRLLVGTSSAIQTGTSNHKLQVSTESSGGLSIISNTANAGNPVLAFAKQRSGTTGGTTIVSDNDGLGRFEFYGADGTDLNTPAAFIECRVDGTPGANDMPGRLVFFTTADGASIPTERMRIRADGTTCIAGDFITGSTTTKAEIQSGSVSGKMIDRTTGAGQIYSSRNSTSSANHFVFYNPNGAVGTISTSASATAYNTSSDYRLKENVVALTGAIDRVNQLQVHRFNFIADPDKTVDGFLAHEAQAVVPECVTGTKDEVDADGNPVYQGIDQSKLVPLLTAALQEALAEIESLKARVTALEP